MASDIHSGQFGGFNKIRTPSEQLFLPFYPPPSSPVEIRNRKKYKKMAADIF